MKRQLLVVMLGLGVLAGCVAFPGKSGRVTVTVKVTDIEGEPLEGAEVGVTFGRIVDMNNEPTHEGASDSEGFFRCRDKAQNSLYVGVKAEGYYSTYYKLDAYEVDDNTDRVRFPDRTVEVVLKEIRDPIVMMATEDFEYRLPRPGERFGVDLFLNDFVEPLGKGKHADMYFTITGEFEDRSNHDSLLEVEFPGEGNGLVSFEYPPESNQGSWLKSDHLAPEEGYDSVKHTRKSIQPKGGVLPENRAMVDYIKESEVREGLGYYIRLRSELDEEGNIISCYYGKIYGDFNFYDADPNGSFVSAGSYYINPTPNDRNVEAVTDETLLPGVDESDRPRWP